MAWALSTVAPQAHRSELACRAVKRPFIQGSLSKAGNPSTLCSNGGSPGIWAASSGDPLIPTCCSAASKGLAGSLAAQPRQAIGVFGAMAPAFRNASRKRWSIRRFHRQSSADGPNCQSPQRAQACPCWSPMSCRAQRCGCQGRRACLQQWASRFWASGWAARTAHTPDAGRGALEITAQSPAANTLSCPSTCRNRLVRTRPSGPTGMPLVSIQLGARLPVQRRLVQLLLSPSPSTSSTRAVASIWRSSAPSC